MAEALLQDLRFAWRSLRRHRGFTLLIVLTLGLGIGATSALFAVVRGVLLTPLPYGNAEGVAVVWSSWKGFDQTWLSYDEYEAWRARIPAFRDVALYSDGAVNVTDGDTPERVRATYVVAHAFGVLGVPPLMGRAFTEAEDRPNGPPAAILAFALWQRRYGGDPAVVGRSIQIDGRAVPVVGVMPAGFRMPLDFGAPGATEIYLPLATDAASEGAVPGPEFSRGGGSHGFYGVARLSSGATVAAANAQLRTFSRKLQDDGNWSPEAHFLAYAVPVAEQVTGGVRTAMLVVFGAVALLLTVACANVAGLLLVRGERRRREVAVRVALGVGVGRLTRLLLTESALLAAMGGVVGAGIAWGGVRVLRAIAPASLPRVADVGIQLPVLLFTILVTTAAAMLFGILPVLQARRVAPAGELREGGRGATAGAARLRWRQALVTGELALAVVLVAAAGLMVRSVANLYAIDPGFDPSRVLTLRLSTPSTWYPDSIGVANFWSNLQRRASAVPGVTSSGAVLLLPLAREMGDWGLRVEGYTPPPNQGTPGDWQVVTPGYFQTMGLRLTEGRALGEEDGFGAPLAMVINHRFAELYLAGRPALGARVRIGGSPDSAWYRVVGVVDDVRHNALTREVKAQFYVTLAQFALAPGNTMRSMSLVVRTRGNPLSVLAPVRSIIREIDPRLPVSQVNTMEQVLGASIASQRFAMQLLSLFGMLAMLLSAIGVYGVVSQAMAARHQEFGIRAALGASPGQLLSLGLGAGLRQVLVGLAVGVGAALVGTRLLVRLLQGVTASDPPTYIGVVLMTAAIALVASAVPARRAARANPGSVLRAD